VIVDLLIVAFVGTLSFRGWKRGALASLASFAGFFAATAAAIVGYRALAPVLRTALRLSPAVAVFAAAAAIFVGVSVAFFFGGRALTRMLRPTKWGTINRVAGAGLSGARALSLVTLAVLAIGVLLAPAAVQRGVHNSVLAREILRTAPNVARSVARTDLRHVLQIFVPSELRLAVRSTDDFARVAEDERTMFDLVNRYRRAQRLRDFVWDERLASAARAHAADMYRNGYFAHESRDGSSPADRLRAAHVPFRGTGENIALAPSLALAHARMVASQAHRRHLLSTSYTRIGVGVMFGPQGLMVDEEFAG
jgi:uncharacterized protein YkwD